MTSPFIRLLLINQLKNVMVLLLKFEVFMGESLDVNKTQKDDCFTIVVSYSIYCFFDISFNI